MAGNSRSETGYVSGREAMASARTRYVGCTAVRRERQRGRGRDPRRTGAPDFVRPRSAEGGPHGSSPVTLVAPPSWTICPVVRLVFRAWNRRRIAIGRSGEAATTRGRQHTADRRCAQPDLAFPHSLPCRIKRAGLVQCRPARCRAHLRTLLFGHGASRVQHLAPTIARTNVPCWPVHPNSARARTSPFANPPDPPRPDRRPHSGS